jgi:hypothetical protein
MFCEVERSYIEDGFNLYGLRACVGNFSDCLDLILDRIGPDDSDDSHLTQSACTLYGLIHARYIITAHGLDAMYNKVSSIRTTEAHNDRTASLSGTLHWLRRWFRHTSRFYFSRILLLLLLLPPSFAFIPVSLLLFAVRRQGIWNLSFGPVQWTARLAGWSQGWNGG